jgi:Kef-type K+ transport system membrane component KefB
MSKRFILAVTFIAIVGLPGLALAASGSGHGSVGPILFGLALLVIAAKAGGRFAERMGQPSVLGELLAGIALGNLLPLVFWRSEVAFVRTEPTILVLAQIGILVLLFDVGLETDLRALLRVGWSALFVAVVGIVVPFALGYGAARWLMPESPALAHVFVGAALTATSIGITARVLKDLGVTQRREAQIILGAALIDDILGLVILAVVTGAVAAAATGGPGVSFVAVGGILVRAVLFLGITAVIGIRFLPPLMRAVSGWAGPEVLLAINLSLCFILAYVAEVIGLADIVGAFAAGIMLDPYGQGVRVGEGARTLADFIHPVAAVFTPLFFVLMGVEVDVGSLMSPRVLLLGVGLVLAALIGKLASGLAISARHGNRLAVGIGMVPRGEVGLIFAGIGAGLSLDGQPILSPAVFSAIVLMVLVTTLVAPPGLRWAFRSREPER